jgi:hypothetical protein
MLSTGHVANIIPGSLLRAPAGVSTLEHQTGPTPTKRRPTETYRTTLNQRWSTGVEGEKPTAMIGRHWENHHVSDLEASAESTRSPCWRNAHRPRHRHDSVTYSAVHKNAPDDVHYTYSEPYSGEADNHIPGLRRDHGNETFLQIAGRRRYVCQTFDEHCEIVDNHSSACRNAAAHCFRDTIVAGEASPT